MAIEKLERLGEALDLLRDKQARLAAERDACKSQVEELKKELLRLESERDQVKGKVEALLTVVEELGQ